MTKSHNSEILDDQENSTDLPCNCPLEAEGKCRTKKRVYEATISNQAESFTYVGIAKAEFKIRYADHKKSMKSDIYQLSTEPSNEELRLYSVCKILQKARPYKIGNTNCDLYVSEKLYLIKF